MKHTYVYASGKLLRETYGDTTLDFFYSNSGQPYALKHNGTVYYYITNLQGDVMSIVDGTGAVVAEYEYDPYGNILSTTGTLADTLGVINPLRYRGYVYDQETGLYYLQSRYYDAKVGRFLNVDAYASTGQGIIGHNMFAYALNNVVNRVDSRGTCSTIFWYKIDCNNANCSTSACYNPNAPTVIVIYDGRFSGIFGYFGDDGFRHQGEELVDRLSTSNNVTSYAYITVDDFVEYWNSLDGTYDTIYILGHGIEGELRFKGCEAIAVEGGEYSYDDLKAVSVKTIHLYCCNGATVDSHEGSIALYFYTLTGATVKAIKDGKLNFTWYGCHPEPAEGGYWYTYVPG